MKKLLSLLLVTLLLFAPTAYAETAAVLTLSDAQVYISDGEEETNLNLDGLKLVAGAPEENLFVINVLGDDQLLLNTAVKVDGQQCLWTIDGISTTYRFALPNTDTADTAENTDGFSLNLEGIDFNAIWENLFNAATISKDGDGNFSFSVPYTAINSALAELLPLVNQLPSGSGVDPEDVEQFIEELNSGNSGVNVEGAYHPTETGMSATLDLIPVSDGTAAEEPAVSFSASFDQNENGFNLTFAADLLESGEKMTLLALTLNTEDGMDLSITVVGSTEVYMRYEPEESLCSVGYSAEDSAFKLSFIVTAGEEGEITLCPVGDAASAVDITDITEEQKAELTGALSPLLEYVSPIIESAA